ncbi:MAG: M1 family metallopeptidase [Thermoplasmata archaeon]
MRITGVDWWLDLRYREKSFTGKVSMEVEGATDPLVVDSAQLTIDSATLDSRPAPFREDAAKGVLEFAGISSQPHRLEITYRGAADPHSLVGLYVSPSGPEYCLTTMMFPTGSRRLLPTFEHPTVKTVYRLVLTVDEDVKAVFNTALRSERPVGGRKELTFDPTPPMSAYLLYLGVGPFDTITVPGNRWSVTVAASPGRAAAGRFSAERATELLAAYEEYYHTPYPLPKLDLIALENFWAGAMENWGAIAFRENMVLVDRTTSVRDRRINLLVLAHEIAHQWFGNLVTPVWWDDFWLNESFATFVGHRIVSRRYPEEDPWSTFLANYVLLALDQDSLSSTHPIKVPVSSPEALGEISDSITYGKGAAVLRMIEAYLGEETFRDGVSRYLAKHRYANARAEDLWAALGEVSDRPVGQVMTEWITRPGYPIIHAQWAGGRLTLRQERFRADGAASPGLWPIPLRVASASGVVTTLFEGAELTLGASSPKGLRIDPGRTAFARVHYDPALFDQMMEEFPSMAPVDQWGLVVDSQAFVYAGLVPLGAFLKLVRAGTSLTEELPVRSLVTALSDLFRPLYDAPAFLSTSREFLRAQLQTVGLEARPNEPDSRGLLRELLAVGLTRVDSGFTQELAPRFADFDGLPAELRGPVANSYAADRGSAAFDPLVARLRSTTRDTERVQMVQALAAFREPMLLRQALDLIPSPGVTPSGALDLLLATSVNPVGGRELFDWYCRHEKSLSEMWAGTPLLSLFLRISLAWSGIDQEEEVKRYFADHTPPDATMAVQQGLESLSLAMRLRRRIQKTGVA